MYTTVSLGPIGSIKCIQNTEITYLDNITKRSKSSYKFHVLAEASSHQDIFLHISPIINFRHAYQALIYIPLCGSPLQY